MDHGRVVEQGTPGESLSSLGLKWAGYTGNSGQLGELSGLKEKGIHAENSISGR